MKFKFSWKYNVAARIKLLARFFRLDIRYGVQIGLSRFIIVRNKILYEIDSITKNISPGCQLPRGNHPLNIVHIAIDGFDEAFYFGEYFLNFKKVPVGIYKRNDVDIWEKVYEFKNGEINHIHNLIPDETNKCVWILTGDFEKSAAIYQARNNFKEVIVVCSGEQIYRSCVAFPHKGGFLYATDTPFQRNTLRYLHKENDQWVNESIAEINGSVGDSTTVSGYFVFSTMVEGDGREAEKSFLKYILNNKKGAGIIRNECVVYRIGDTDLPIEILSNKKDMLPFVFFQFGIVKFPTGKNQSNYLPLYNIGTKKHDLSLALYKLTS
ncbi:hypothetical protein AGMMS49940_11800 [Spirochaetia bacterium]|nr:hypothetical protein AGMMS49940_11800 [Spirochaetia bacterium]